MNGQILGRTEYAYTIFQHPKQIAWMWRDGGWTPAEVAENFDKILGQHLQQVGMVMPKSMEQVAHCACAGRSASSTSSTRAAATSSSRGAARREPTGSRTSIRCSALDPGHARVADRLPDRVPEAAAGLVRDARAERGPTAMWERGGAVVAAPRPARCSSRGRARS